MEPPHANRVAVRTELHRSVTYNANLLQHTDNQVWSSLDQHH